MAPPLPKTKKSARGGGSSSSNNATTPAATTTSDPRFAAIATDPRYRLPSAKHSRVNVDDRFSRMFRDEEFSKKAAVDRYGRRVKERSGKRDLERFYRLEKEDGNGKGEQEKEEDEEDEEIDEGADGDDEVQAELDRVEKKGASVRDYARQGGFSDSSSDEDSSDEESDVEDEEDDREAQDVVTFPDEEQAADVPMGEVSNRLAVVNLDWDNIRATDLMAVAQSFAPAGGKGVQKVVVYPSEFGRERLEREELEGPPRDIFASTSSKRKSQDVQDDEDSDEEEERIKKELLAEDTGEEFDSARLRQYQLDRLKYYYAVITCDTKETAKVLYDDMDGREYLTTANFFDLRFIPDEVSFDTDTPRDKCSKLPPGYKPNEFVTDALTHSKVRLTWDADDTTRKEVQKRAFSRAEIDENDLQAYIGSDSDSDDGGEHGDGDNGAPKLSKAEQQRHIMRAALGLSSGPSKPSSSKKTDKELPVGDMQITFTSGLSGPSSSKSKSGVFENEPLTNETTREKYIRKERERKQRRKEKAKSDRPGADATDPAAEVAAELSAEADDQEQGDDAGFDDPFFTNPAAAHAAEKAARKAEKAKIRAERDEADRATAAQRAELELLMVDDKADSKMRHFDMKEIAKAEKDAKKKKKKGSKQKGKEGHERQEVDGEDFEIETQDPRFRGLFESHEFAIDPTNPRFVGTKGMKALLDEGRKKRKGRGDDDEEEGDGGREEEKQRKGKKVKRDGGDGVAAVSADTEDLQKLLARVKAKGKRK